MTSYFPSRAQLSFLTFVFLCICSVSASPPHAHYIIVGAGTAGCALAARLCVLRPDRNITLLERSRPRNASQEFLVRSPRQMLLSWFTEELADGFPSLPNPALNNRSFRVFTGNTLGGTSSINGMQFSIPIKQTVEKWGIDGLTTASSKKYFQRVIDQIGVAVPKGNLRHKYVRDYIRAARKAGFEESVDVLDDGNSRSMSENRLTVDPKGFRRDSCTAYLSPAIKGKCKNNLRLVQDAMVTRILLSKSRPQRAFGVEYVGSEDTELSNPKRVLARKEVIACAGPFGSPKLLQASGIGPPKVLRKAGVKVRVALPVGKRCQAKAVTPLDVKYTGVPLEPSMNSTLVNSEEELQKFKSGKGGVLGIAASFATGKDKRNGFISANGHTFPVFFDRNALGGACTNNVRSFGYYRIKDKNPFSTPELQLALLTRQDDLKRVIKCLNGVTETFRNLAPQFNSSIENPVDGEITEEWVRRTAVWNGHFVGGCPVGGVLRGDLTVRKVRQLRVVDASSLKRMPVSAGPMGSVYMIAEYMAEVIAGASTTKSRLGVPVGRASGSCPRYFGT